MPIVSSYYIVHVLVHGNYGPTTLKYNMLSFLHSGTSRNVYDSL